MELLKKLIEKLGYQVEYVNVNSIFIQGITKPHSKKVVLFGRKKPGLLERWVLLHELIHVVLDKLGIKSMFIHEFTANTVTLYPILTLLLYLATGGKIKLIDIARFAFDINAVISVVNTLYSYLMSVKELKNF